MISRWYFRYVVITSRDGEISDYTVQRNNIERAINFNQGMVTQYKPVKGDRPHILPNVLQINEG